MMQLFMLLIIVIGTYCGLTLLSRMVPEVWLSRSLRGRISLAIFFIFTGMSHFFRPELFVQMLPPILPMQFEIIYATGFVQILGAVGLLFPRVAPFAAVGLILFLIGVLPANIYAAYNSVSFGGSEAGPVYLLARIPFQLFLIGWAYYFGINLHSPSESKSLSRSALV